MKFLSISSMKDTASTLPPSVARQLVEASISVINRHKKAGKVLEVYSIPGWDRNVVISEAKSAEEVVQRISEFPVAAFMNFEVYPLADWDESTKITLKSLKAAEKMMPSSHK
jgi:muconolactone delta-isomerase